MRRSIDFGLGAWEQESFGVQEAQRWLQLVKLGDPLVGKMLMKAAGGGYPQLNKNLSGFIKIFLDSVHCDSNQNLECFFGYLNIGTFKKIKLKALNLDACQCLVHYSDPDLIPLFLEELHQIRPGWDFAVHKKR